ncbi:homoserine O-acetyltransferase domain protein [Mycobacterium xenopi 3993]|nr:homoserine O-acetyltransferase domain protein [Mycobacterium xenopi 3993]
MTISDVPTQRLPAEGEVGLVDIGSLRLESGAVIDDVCIAVQRWGELSPARDNVVVVLHALTGDSHITGPAGQGIRPRVGGTAWPARRADRHQPLVCDCHQCAGRLPRLHRAQLTRP